MIKIGTKIGYIQRQCDENNKINFKFIESRVSRIFKDKDKTVVCVESFNPVDANEIIIDSSRKYIFVSKLFVMKDGDSEYFNAVVDRRNKKNKRNQTKRK